MTQEAYSVQRGENRVAMKVLALLVGKNDALRVETGFTEDVSSRGARVVSETQWPLGETILVVLPGFNFRSAARIAYCDPLSAGSFGIGLQFVAAAEHLEITALATALQFSRT